MVVAFSLVLSFLNSSLFLNSCPYLQKCLLLPSYAGYTLNGVGSKPPSAGCSCQWEVMPIYKLDMHIVVHRQKCLNNQSYQISELDEHRLTCNPTAVCKSHGITKETKCQIYKISLYNKARSVRAQK